MRLLLRVASALAIVLTGACGSATGPTGGERDAVVERAWLDDPAGVLSPEDALGRVWTPFDGTLSRGYVTSTTWLRLRIDPAAAGPPTVAADHRVVLVVMPGHLDEIAVHRVDRLSDPPVLVGDTHRVPSAGPRLLPHAVVFDDAVAPFEVLLRLRTQSHHSIDVQGLRWDVASAQNLEQHALVIAFAVFTLMVMAWAAAVWLEWRDPLVGWFLAHEGVVLLVALLLTGVLRLYGPDGLEPALDRLTSLSVPLSSLIALRFHTRLLGDLDVGKTDSTLLRALALGPLVGLTLVALDVVRIGLLVSQVSLVVIVVLTVVTASRVRLEPSGESASSAAWRRSYLIVVYVWMMLLTLPQSMRALGLMRAPRWSFFGFVAYGVASAFLMGLLLAYRAAKARWHRRHDELAYAKAQREAAAQHARATEQSEMLTMLTHELKTPLSVVSLALGDGAPTASMRARALRAIDNMRDVVDRCEQTARYDDDSARLDPSTAFAPVELDEVLDAAIDALGHADRVDCYVAETLPACCIDRQMALIVVGNMLENAIKYGPSDGRVRVCLDPVARGGRPGVAVRVANRVGQAGRPDAAHLFHKYHRGVRARHQSGSGLGLYLSHRLAIRLGGALSLRHPEDDDVEFELWLPCTRSSAPAVVP